MTVDDLRAKIGHHYLCRQGIFSALCNTREPYVTIGIPKHGVTAPAVIPGTVAEGYPSTTWTDEAEAAKGFPEAFNKYAAACEALRRPGDGPLVLWWRYAEPHIFFEYAIGKKNWTLERPRFPTKLRIRCRMCLTGKPVVWKTQGEYDAFSAAQKEMADGTRE